MPRLILAPHTALVEECCIFFAREYWQANAEIGVKKPGRRFQMLLSAEVVSYDRHPSIKAPIAV